MDIKTTFKDVDSYLSVLTEKERAVLEKLRQTIKAIAPEAEEVISYQMPMFKYHGMLVAYAAAKNHFGFYPCNSTSVEQFKNELKGYVTSKGAIQFPKDKPLPVALIKKIVKARMKENLNKKKNK